jgi:antibiotic biosynthesis monooxygenase (ABM) superfamily enzyme
MSEERRPVLSVIVRRFPEGLGKDIERFVSRIEQAVATQPGFVGLQSSVSHKEDCDELVTIFAFDSRENLELWDSCPVRQGLVKELDRHSHDAVQHVQSGDLSLLLSPKAQVGKIEIVVMLIFWILTLGGALRYFADFVFPDALSPIWQNVLLISVNVVLISYVFLPWSSMMLTKLKARIFRIARGK